MSKQELVALSEAIERDIREDGPIVLWTGTGDYPGGRLRGLSVVNYKCWLDWITRSQGRKPARAKKARGKA